MLISYVAAQIVMRPAVFLRRWYVDFSRLFWARVIDQGAAFDRMFAVKIMFQTLTQPLYGDYSTIGRIIGPIFRASRIVLSFPVLAAYFAVSFLLWAAWVLILPYLIFRIIAG